MKFTRLYLIISIVFFSFSSCRTDSNTRILSVVNKWVGEKLPPMDSLDLYVINDNRDNDSIALHKYVIFHYVDKPKCTSCELRLPEYKYLIKKISEVSKTDIGFCCAISTDDVNELSQWLKRDCINTPIYVDTNDVVKKELKLENSPRFHTMLLDSVGRVLAIGDPLLNKGILDLYVSILRKARLTGEAPSATALSCEFSGLDNIRLNRNSVLKKEIEISNIGNFPFILDSIITSCNCIKACLSKRKILPNEKAILKIEFDNKENGHFYKTVEIRGNIRNNLVLEIEGVAK